MLITIKEIEASIERGILKLDNKNITDNDIPVICNYLAEHKEITYLSLSRNKIGDTGAKALAENKTLKSLDLSRNQIGKAGLDALEQNPRLTDLNLLWNLVPITIEQMKRQTIDDELIVRSGPSKDDAVIETICDYLKENPQITYLDFSQNECTVKGVSLLAKTALAALDLSYNQLNDEHLIALAKSEHLIDLDLSNNPDITDRGIAALEKNKNLVRITLESNKGVSTEKLKSIELRNQQNIDNVVAQQKKGNLKHLQVIYHSENKILERYHAPTKEVAKPHIPKTQSNDPLILKNVKYEAQKSAPILWLNAKNIGNDDLESICDYLNKHREITGLSLCYTKITDEGIHFLKPLKYITRLFLSHNSLTDKSAIELAKHETITVLDLSSNHIGTPGAKALAQNEKLRHLNVEYNRIGTAGIDALQNHSKATYLLTLWNQSSITVDQMKRATKGHTLTLSGGRCNDEDIEVICNYLKENPHIKTLVFEDNRCSPKGAKLLATTALETLHIRHNQLNDEALIALAESKHLMSLYLADPNITDKGISALEKNKNLICMTVYGAKVSAEKHNAIQLKYFQNINRITSEQLKGNLKDLQVIYDPVRDKLKRYRPQVTKDFNPQLLKIIASFNQLQEKKFDFDTKAAHETDQEMKATYLAAATALDNTIERLNDPLCKYRQSIIDIDALKTSVNTILSSQDAKKDISVICSHRSSKQFWIEFIGAIFTFGVSLIYKAVTGHTLFNQTDSANRLDALKDSINTPGPSKPH